MIKRRVTPDIVTDQTPYDNLPYGIIPVDLTPIEAEVLRKENLVEFVKLVSENAVKVVKSIIQFKERGTMVCNVRRN